MVIREDQREDPVSPASDLATTKVTKLTPGSTCQAPGYEKGGCSNIAIAWKMPTPKSVFILLTSVDERRSSR